MRSLPLLLLCAVFTLYRLDKSSLAAAHYICISRAALSIIIIISHSLLIKKWKIAESFDCNQLSGVSVRLSDVPHASTETELRVLCKSLSMSKPAQI